MAAIEELRAAIQQQHGCDSTLIESVDIREDRAGRIMWEGEVHVFTLHGHQRARRCYAWQDSSTGGDPRFVAILEIGHIDSPRAAVRAAMVNESRRQGS